MALPSKSLLGALRFGWFWSALDVLLLPLLLLLLLLLLRMCPIICHTPSGACFPVRNMVPAYMRAYSLASAGSRLPPPLISKSQPASKPKPTASIIFSSHSMSESEDPIIYWGPRHFSNKNGAGGASGNFLFVAGRIFSRVT